MCAHGLSGADLATRFWLSEGTIRDRVSELLGKLGVQHRAEAVKLAKECGAIGVL
jgi:two-component system response regulator DesR